MIIGAPTKSAAHAAVREIPDTTVAPIGLDHHQGIAVERGSGKEIRASLTSVMRIRAYAH
jgi:hypothetical protein